MSSEIIRNVAYDNYDDFQCVNKKCVIKFHNNVSYFHKISFHYFKDYLMMKLTLG